MNKHYLFSKLQYIVKFFLPIFIRSKISNFLSNRALAKLGQMDIAETFDTIYSKKMWAQNSEKLSGKGSYGEWANQFVALVHQFIIDNNVHSIADIGCGDFNIGSQICEKVEQYYAMDVSQIILNINKNRFGALKNVSFIQSNACLDPIPKADLVILKEVMQHLSNIQIESLLQNIERSGNKLVLIADHIIPLEKMIEPNRDLRNQSPATRKALNSGVFINAPPFSRQAKLIANFPISQYRRLQKEEGSLAVFCWNL